jgi:uncharacterized protein (TIGR04255 family)
MNDLPKKISPCPIIEANFEMRFNSNFPEDAIFGVIYSQLQSEFPKVDYLPITQLPHAIKMQDKNLAYAPYYKLSNKEFVVQIGPKVFSVGCVGDYIGWDDFSSKIKNYYQIISELPFINQFTRYSLRYINLFNDTNFLADANFNINIDTKSLWGNRLHLIVELPLEKSISVLKILDNAQAAMRDGMVSGSVIDIESSVAPEEFNNFEQALEHIHDTEKELFFRVLGKTAILKLNPAY